MSTIEEVAVELRSLGYRVEPLRVPGEPVVLNVWRPGQDVYTVFVVAGPFTIPSDSTPTSVVQESDSEIQTEAEVIADSIDKSVSEVIDAPESSVVGNAALTGSVDVSESIVLKDFT